MCVLNVSSASELLVTQKNQQILHKSIYFPSGLGTGKDHELLLFVITVLFLKTSENMDRAHLDEHNMKGHYKDGRLYHLHIYAKNEL